MTSASTKGPAILDTVILKTISSDGIRTSGDELNAIPHPSDYDRWLDREETERLPVDLLRPFESEA